MLAALSITLYSSETAAADFLRFVRCDDQRHAQTSHIVQLMFIKRFPLY
jgi:hypothetical protein